MPSKLLNCFQNLAKSKSKNFFKRVALKIIRMDKLFTKKEKSLASWQSVFRGVSETTRIKKLLVNNI
jgi:hypothetical protein